jgi:hypothetical protein
MEWVRDTNQNCGDPDQNPRCKIATPCTREALERERGRGKEFAERWLSRNERNWIWAKGNKNE